MISGILRGCGRQSWGAALNLTCFWGLGLPLAWWLGFKAGFGLNGLWSGLTIATTLLVRFPPIPHYPDTLLAHPCASSNIRLAPTIVNPPLRPCPCLQAFDIRK